MNNIPHIKIGDRYIGDLFKPYILAEMACAHDGNPDLAHQLVDIAANADVDGVQLQIFSAKNIMAKHHPGYDLSLKLEISLNDWVEIVNHAKDCELDVWVTVFDETCFEIINDKIAAVKIHSSDIANLELLELVARTKKPVSLSAGGTTIDELAQAIFFLRDKDVKDLLLMHGYQAYPTKISESRINFIKTLRKIFNCPVGYMDHTDGDSDLAFILPILAFAIGSAVIEKHITIDRSLKNTDYESALNPDELKKFVKIFNKISNVFGDGDLVPISNDELNYRHNFKKSIVASRNIKSGEIINKEMLLYVRAGAGLPPTDIDKIIDRVSLQDIKEHNVIKQEWVGEKITDD